MLAHFPAQHGVDFVEQTSLENDEIIRSFLKFGGVNQFALSLQGVCPIRGEFTNGLLYTCLRAGLKLSELYRFIRRIEKHVSIHPHVKAISNRNLDRGLHIEVPPRDLDPQFSGLLSNGR